MLGLSLVAASRVSPAVAEHGLLVAVASLVTMSSRSLGFSS